MDKIKITKRLDWGKYASSTSDRTTIPFNWYSFKHKFGSQLVSEAFSMFGLSKGDTVLDPFCGGGTTLIKAKLDGYNAVGLDISPFSVFLTNALTTNYNVSKLKEAIKKISHRINYKVKIPDVGILEKSFSETTLKYIFSLRNSINLLKSPERKFFLLVLLSILDSVSKTKQSGGFLRITDQRKVSYETVKNEFIRTAEGFINDLEHFSFSKASSTAVIGDARQYSKETNHKEYDAIFTSPPYPNRHDYTRIYGLELLIGFLDNNDDLKSLRYETLRSHVEARTKYEAKDYVIPSVLKGRINRLKKKKLNNSQIISTLYGYFEDMYLSLKQMAKVLKKDGHIGLVVSNVRFEGVSIPVDQLLAEIGEQVGLQIKAIHVLRYKGNSSQQMSRYEREPNRESLIVWQK